MFNVPGQLVRSFGVIFISDEFGHPVTTTWREIIYILYVIGGSRENSPNVK